VAEISLELKECTLPANASARRKKKSEGFELRCVRCKTSHQKATSRILVSLMKEIGVPAGTEGETRPAGLLRKNANKEGRPLGGVEEFLIGLEGQ